MSFRIHLIAIAMLVSLTTAHAQTNVTYVGMPGGFWHNPGNWNPMIVPDNDLGAMPPIYYSVTTQRSVAINGGQFDISDLDMSAEIFMYTSFDFRSPDTTSTILSSGTLTMAPDPAGASCILGIHDLVTHLGGTIVMGGAGTARIFEPGDFANDVGTIIGKGSIGEGSMEFSNDGTVIAMGGTAAEPATLNIFTRKMVNSGVIRSSPTGRLDLRSAGTGLLQDVGGTIIADTSDVVLAGVLLDGGTLSSTGGGRFTVATHSGNAPQLSNLTTAGSITVGDTLLLSETINNTGFITVAGNLRIKSTDGAVVILTGGGSVLLSTGSITQQGSGASLRNTDNLIFGSGVLGSATLQLVNLDAGEIQALSSAGNPLTIELESEFEMANTGTLSARSGILLISGIHSGTLLNSGTILAGDDGTVAFVSNPVIHGGQFYTTGNGLIRVAEARFLNAKNNGVLEIGPSGSILRTSGSFQNTGTVNLKNSQIQILSGSVSLSGGTWNIENSSIVPAVGSFSGDGKPPNEGSSQLLMDGFFRGAGAIGINGLAITNNGTIRGDGSIALTIDPSPDGLMNSGTIEATGSAQVILTGSGGGSFMQGGGGMIRAVDPGSNVHIFNNAQISGGQLGAGAGSISAAAGIIRLENLTNNAKFMQVGVTTVSISNGFTNNGTISTPVNANFIIDGSFSSASGYHLNTGAITVLAGASADFGFLENATTLSNGRVTVSSGATMMAHSIDQATLTIQNSATATLKSSATPNLEGSLLNNLSIGTLGALDITNRGAAVIFGSVTTIAGQVTTGYAGGAWNGFGIRTSSAASLAGSSGFGVGYAVANQIGSPPTFLGRPITSTTVLFRYTLLGDADLNAVVDIADFSRVATNFNTPGPWVEGDFDYTQFVDIGDFALLASNFNESIANELPGASIPEPIGAVIGAFTLLTPRRRKRARLPYR